MDKQIVRLPGWEDEAYLWIEQDSSIMAKIVSKFGDPLELTADEARLLAVMLNTVADDLDARD